jgi:hypothetical protein
MRYEYASITSLSEYKKLFSSDMLKSLSRLYSDRINRITRKVFIATPNTIRVNPYDSTLIPIPGPKIIKIESITAEYSNGGRLVLNPGDYSIQGNNLIRLNSIPRHGLDALEIGYIMGEVESPKEVEVVLDSPIGPYEVSASLVDASQVEPRDVLVFGKTIIIVNSVDYESNIIDFDDVGNIQTIGQGTGTTCYGQVPIQIEEAVKLFVKHHKKLQGFSGRIKSERIGKSYSYDSVGLENTITGIAEIDSVLILFINDDFDILYL